MIVLNPEEGHAGGPVAGGSWAYRALYAPLDLMRRITAEFSPGVPAMSWFAADVVRDPQIATLLLRFHKLSESPRSSTLQREATETGFCDQAHLTRHFKRTVGLSPGATSQA
jgi:hypothetical protein